VEFRFPVILDSGTNRIEVIASNGYSEGRALVEVSYNTRQNTLPNLRILAIGVSRYDNLAQGEQLRYCGNDAQAIITAFKSQEGKRYAQVQSRLIADGTALTPTAESIRDGLDFLSGAGPRDVAVLFLSGHGMNDSTGNYFFLPKDVTFNDDGSPRRARAITNSEILDVLNRLAGQKLVFIDSCYSAGVAGRQDQRTDNNQLINGLKDAAPAVFTSSRGNELSREWPAFGFGLFTHALVQGLGGAADDNKDSKIQIEELDRYVQKTVSGLNAEQHPYYLAPPGYAEFVVAEIK
jgi:uncharacterized caspase-like protein